MDKLWDCIPDMGEWCRLVKTLHTDLGHRLTPLLAEIARKSLNLSVVWEGDAALLISDGEVIKTYGLSITQEVRKFKYQLNASGMDYSLDDVFLSTVILSVVEDTLGCPE